MPTVAAKSGSTSHFGKHHRTNSRLSARTLSAGRLHNPNNAGGNLGFTTLKGGNGQGAQGGHDKEQEHGQGTTKMKRNDSAVSVRSDLTVQRGHGAGLRQGNVPQKSTTAVAPLAQARRAKFSMVPVSPEQAGEEEEEVEGDDDDDQWISSGVVTPNTQEDTIPPPTNTAPPTPGPGPKRSLSIIPLVALPILNIGAENGEQAPTAVRKHERARTEPQVDFNPSNEFHPQSVPQTIIPPASPLSPPQSYPYSATAPSSRPPSVSRRSGHFSLRGGPPPLIRTPSFAPPNFAPPLTTASTASAQLSGPSSPSPSYMPGHGSATLHSSPPGSPGSIKTAMGKESNAKQQLRRASVSSARSSATLPTALPLSSNSHRHSYNPPAPSFTTPRLRERTISTFSTTSKPSASGFTHPNASAALTSLSAIPSSRPATPPLVSHFPPSRVGEDEPLHPLLPAPYLATHLTVTRFYGPLQESWGRVVGARTANAIRAGKA